MIIQLRGDRTVRVACNIDESRPDSNIEKVIEFPVDGDNQGVVNLTINGTSGAPSVKLRVVDLATGDIDTNQTIVGKLLQLRLDVVNPPTARYDIETTNLLATDATGSLSFLLVDSLGCPANPRYFPGFTRDGDTGSYMADFSAFKFPNSPLVRFQGMVHFCDDECQQIDCISNNPTFQFRQRRNQLLQSNQSRVGKSISNFIDQSDGGKSSMSQSKDKFKTASQPSSRVGRDIPLEFDLVVLPSPSNDEPHILANTFSGSNESSQYNPGRRDVDILTTVPGDYLCAPRETALSVLISWIVLQIIIFFVCCYIVRRQLNKQDKELRKKLKEDLTNFDTLHHQVHWSSNVEAVAT